MDTYMLRRTVSNLQNINKFKNQSIRSKITKNNIKYYFCLYYDERLIYKFIFINYIYIFILFNIHIYII